MDSSDFLAYIQQRVIEYFPNLSDSTNVSFDSKNERYSAILYYYTIGDQKIIVKKRKLQSIDKYSSTRPRRFQIDASDTFEAEYRALQNIDRVITQHNDPLLGSIQVLDVLPEEQAFIMTAYQAPTFNSLFIKQNRLQAPFNPTDLTPLFYRAGSWLKLFHDLELDQDTQVCYTTRQDYIESIEQFITFLNQHIDDEMYFDALSSNLTHYANKYLPHDLPLGRLHADYAMRNILVNPEQQLVVIDTLAKWQTSIYDDLGYFIARLWTNKLQTYSLGLIYSCKLIQHYQQAFLSAYFDQQSIPKNAVNLYVILATLDQWTSQLVQLDRLQSSPVHLNIQARKILTPIHFKNIIAKFLSDLTSIERQ